LFGNKIFYLADAEIFFDNHFGELIGIFHSNQSTGMPAESLPSLIISLTESGRFNNLSVLAIWLRDLPTICDRFLCVGEFINQTLECFRFFNGA
jgi:hypothetical protein